MNIGIIGRSSYAKMIQERLPKKFNLLKIKGFSEEKKKIKDLDIIITMCWGKTVWGGDKKSIIPKVSNLKLIQLPGSGLDGIDFSKIPKGCKVCNVYEHETPVSEYIIANILNWELNLIKKIKKFRSYNWEDSMLFSESPAGEISNKRVGIIGYGRIGQELAKKLSNFNVFITVVSRKPIKDDGYINKNILIDNINEEISNLDYIVIACDLNESSKGLISKEMFNLMKSETVLINIARAPIINEKDLYFALKQKKIGGAIIDTWYKYPNKKNKKLFMPSKYDFRKLNNIIMTPHLSALSKNLLCRRVDIIISNILSLKSGKKLKNIVYG